MHKIAPTLKVLRYIGNSGNITGISPQKRCLAMAKLKIYTAIVHTTSRTLKGYACTTSKIKAAKILGLPQSQINDHMSEVTGREADKYDHLSEGESVFEDLNRVASEPAKHIRDRDLLQIGDITIIQAAERMLQSCDIQDQGMKTRLNNIRDELTELRIDLNDHIRERYRAYKK